MNKVKTFLGRMLLALGVLGFAALPAHAAYTDPAPIVDTATTVFNTVTVLVVAMVGFFIIVRIVKGIRK